MAEDVYERVLSYIDDPEADDFNAVALAVFGQQFESCGPYRAFCEGRSCEPARIDDWRDIPAVPIQAFKEVELSCGAPERVFLSTGTTAGPEKRSRHSMPDLRLYHRSAVAGLRQFLFPDVEGMDLVSLIPAAAERPDSSLAQMAEWAAEEVAGGEMPCAIVDGSPRFDVLVAALRRSEDGGRPLCILATTGALIHFLDHARDKGLVFRLPHGSRIMDTGGDKGAPRRLSRKGLTHAIWSTFAIPGYFAVNEYGMAELSSQYYDSVIRDRFHGIHRSRHLAAPHWLRPVVADPETLAPTADGVPGLLCHYDLANAGSAMAVLSEDIGIVEDGRLRILGRAPRAELRGCSLNVADWLPQAGDRR